MFAGRWVGYNGPSLADLERKSMPLAAAIYRGRRPESDTDYWMPTDWVSGINGQQPWLKDKPAYRREGDLPSNYTGVDNVPSEKLGDDGCQGVYGDRSVSDVAPSRF